MNQDFQESNITKNFNTRELRCKCGCHNLVVDVAFMEKVQKLRDMCGFPFIVTSYYRCPGHPDERQKDKPGLHTQGLAIDIKKPQGTQGYLLLKNAIACGFNGIGVANTFIHLDIRKTPALWSY